MIRAGAALSTLEDPRAAAAEAASKALAAAGAADGALLFATPGPARDPSGLLEAAIEVLGTEIVVGATGHGVMAAGRECEGSPAVAALVWSGLEAHPFLLSDLAGGGEHAGEEIAARLDGGPRDSDLVVLLPDPRALEPDALLAGIRSSLGPARVVGAGAADPVADHPFQWCGRRFETGALAGIALRGERPVRVGVTQACRPATERLTVTRARGNWILEIEGRPALDVYREVARAPLADDLRRAASFLLVAFPVAEEGPLAPGSYVVRHVVGFSTGKRAFAVPEAVRTGQRIALAVREPEAARDDLKAMLAGVHTPSPALALYLDCCARGGALFGVPGLEAAYIENALGPCPVAGVFGSCEIGPIGGVTELLTYTGVLALLDG